MAHELGALGLRVLGHFGPLRSVKSSVVAKPSKGFQAFGRRLDSPLGLAAGFDKNATLVRGIAQLGFGFMEVGTVTPLPQAGNPRPRLFRLPQSQALVNRLGFNNAGVDAMAEALEKIAPSRRSLPPLGINIGKNKATPNENALDDYRRCLERLYNYADFFVVNISSPNTPGLRDLLALAQLKPLLTGIRETMEKLARTRPGDSRQVLLKISPDMAEADLLAAAGLAMEQGFAGIIATNTTIARAGLVLGDELALATALNGGLSGRPLAPLARNSLVQLRQALGPKPLLISVGGIDSVAAIEERLALGADLVEAYTAFVYNGPAWPAAVQRSFKRI